MRLFAAIVPPEHIRAEIADLVRSCGPDTPELDPVPVSGLRIPVTTFGNVSQADSFALSRMLRQAAAGWPKPELLFHGSAALEWEGDRSVWTRADGDVEGLLTIGRGVPVAVHPLGFLVDRRKFRPWLSVGTITDSTTLPYLERLIEALNGFKSATWRQETLTVFHTLPPAQGGEVVHEEIPLGA